MIGKIACVGESLTATHQCLYEVRVRRKTIYPPPPSKLSEWLWRAVAVSNPVSFPRIQAEGERTHKIKTNENVEVNNNTATSIARDIAGTVCLMVV
jgi:hypothetical protein